MLLFRLNVSTPNSNNFKKFFKLSYISHNLLLKGIKPRSLIKERSQVVRCVKSPGHVECIYIISLNF